MHIFYSQHRVDRDGYIPYFPFRFLFCFFFTAIFMQGWAQAVQDLPPGELKKLSVEELMNIEVTSVSKRPEKLTEVASAIQVITGEDIRRSGATSVPEALRLAPNLQVAQVNASQWTISARGFDNVLANKLLVLIDGRTVYTPLYAGVFWDAQNLLLEDVDRIEVISGPGGTLWGSNAVNGVINIITKSSKATRGLLAEGGAGSELRSYGGLRYGGNITNDISFRVYGTGFKKGSTVLTNDSDAKDEWTMGQGGFRIDWDAQKNSTLSLQANAHDNRPDPDGNNPIIARGTNILAKWSHSLSEKSHFQLQAYYDRTWRDFKNGLTEDLKTYDVDWQDHHQVGKRHKIAWGAGVRLMDHRITNPELFAFLPGQKTLHIYSAFLQDEITLIEKKLRFTVGSKVEHYTYAGFQYSPNGRLSWTPSENHMVWAAVSRAVRTPSRIDRDFFLYVAPGVPYISGSGDDFKSETVIAYELGWRFKTQETLSFSAATFHNVYDNIRSVTPGPPPGGFPVTFGNAVRGDTYGVELSGIYQASDWWRVRGGYTFLKKNLSIKPGEADLNGGTAESNDPEQQFLIQSMMDIPGRIELGVVARYIDKLSKPNVPGYTGLDVRIGWKLNKIVELNVVGQNLIDSNHSEFVPTSPAPRKIQRSIYGKITCRI